MIPEEKVHPFLLTQHGEDITYWTHKGIVYICEASPEI